MKRIIAIISALAIILSLSACSAQNGTTEKTTGADETTSSVPVAENKTVSEETATKEEEKSSSEEETKDEKSSENITKDGKTENVKTTANGKSGKKTTANSVKPTKNGKQPSKKPSSTAEIVNLYTKAANEAKISSKSIYQEYLKNSSAGITLSGILKSIQGLANGLINDNMGIMKDRSGKTYTSNSDRNKFFPVENQSYASKLTTSNVKSATCTESGGKYIITIVLKDDLTSVSNAMAPVTKQAIVDGAGSAGMAVIKEESIKVTYSNCTIKATIDANSGKLLSLYHKLPWTLKLNALGTDVSLPVTIEQSYNINW